MPYDTTLVADRHLVRAMLQGDAEALHALQQRHSTTVYALAYGILVDSSEADEVVADTFAYVRRSAARFLDTAHRSVSLWLSEIARSHARGSLLARSWPRRPDPAKLGGRRHTILEEVGR